MAASSSSSPSILKKYDVFLSFRGEDTRNNFTSHLYKGLCDKEIETYIDSTSLEKGDEIGPALLEAIRQSTIAIVVFSDDYASSSWCLNELLHILECEDKDGLILLPVFYKVDPSDIRNLRGSYGAAFRKHAKGYSDAKLQQWRSALEKAARDSGWDSKFRVEAELVQEIVKDVLGKLSNLASTDGLEGLIGIENHIRKIKKFMSIQSTEVHIVGICGMGGIGKTTIASVVFNQLLDQFSGSCFTANVREESEKVGIRSLRDQLLSQVLKDEKIYSGNPSLKPSLVRRLRRRKVLLVLDDVSDYEQFEYISGGDWFGPESRIIVTTRDLQVLTSINAHSRYEVKIREVRQLEFDDALELFRLTAFKGINSPRSDYVAVSKQVVLYAGGIPLVIKTLGSYLRSCVLKGKPWEITLETLKECSPENVQKKLVISYQGLNKLERAVFLDIACFFKGTSQDRAAYILTNLYRSANWLIENLIEKSLVTTRGYDKQLWMHDLLEEMGWEIVREESKMLGKRSRLWIAQEVCDVLEENKGTEAIEKMVLDKDHMVEDIHLSAMVFQPMTNLRLLIVHSYDAKKCKVYFPEGLQYFPRALIYVDWPSFPANSLPSKSSLRNLVELKLPFSNLEQLWDETVVQPLEQLVRLDLSHSEKLTRFPNLSGAPSLEVINLEHCTSLLQIPPDHLDHVEKLIDFNLSHCSSLFSLPDTIVASSLKVLKLSGCSNLTTIPQIIGTSMDKLYVDSTSIKEVPSWIGSHSHLSLLSVKHCKFLESLPTSIHGLEFIDSLSLTGCSVLEDILELPKNVKEFELIGSTIKKVPSCVESLIGLESINLSHCLFLESLPSSIFKPGCLKELILSNCSNLRSIPEISEPVGNIRIMKLAGTAIKELPSSIHNLIQLHHLDISSCQDLEALPNKLCIMHSLKILSLNKCSKLDRLSSLAGLTSLQSLTLSGTSITRVPPSIKRLSKLDTLWVKNCANLRSLTELPQVLEYLDASGCPLLETFCNSEAILAQGAACNDYHISEESVVSFMFYECLNLDPNDLMLNFRYRVLRKALRYVPEDYLGYIPSVNCCCPGAEVPEWFDHQSEGSSIKINLPAKWNSKDLLGFAVCAVACGESDPHPVTMRLSAKFHQLKSNRGEADPILWRFNGGTREGEVPPLNSPHLFTWFQYQQYRRDADEASFEFYFEEYIDATYTKSHSTRVLRCGIRVLYRRDGEEFGFRPHNLYLIDAPTEKCEISGSGEVKVRYDLGTHMVRRGLR